MINKIIRNYIAKRMAGRSDDGIMITLKDPQRVTLGENIMADLLMRNGINPVEITSEAQLKAILQQIENAEAAAIRNTGIRNTESAKVFNLEGQKLDPNKTDHRWHSDR
jgi:ABC-type Fe3+-citrate transport system substrate-binding protein